MSRNAERNRRIAQRHEERAVSDHEQMVRSSAALDELRRRLLPEMAATVTLPATSSPHERLFASGALLVDTLEGCVGVLDRLGIDRSKEAGHAA